MVCTWTKQNHIPEARPTFVSLIANGFAFYCAGLDLWAVLVLELPSLCADLAGSADESGGEEGQQEAAKILQQMGFPEMEKDVNFSADHAPKVSKCLQKRQAKCHDWVSKLEAMPQRNSVQNS